MCLLLVAYNVDPQYPLIVAANRDEFYNRPTAPATFWKEERSILAGKDLRSGGTWLGVTRQGKIAAITNFRDLPTYQSQAPSRGLLVKNFLERDDSSEAYSRSLSGVSKQYNGFNMIFGGLYGLHYFSSRGNVSQELSPGIYGLSNHLLDTPWPKVKKTTEKLSRIIIGGFTEEAVFEMLADTTVYEDPLLPNTGVGIEKERILSSIFIKSPDYGTRSSTIVTVDAKRNLTFVERSFQGSPEVHNTVRHEFKLERGKIS